MSKINIKYAHPPRAKKNNRFLFRKKPFNTRFLDSGLLRTYDNGFYVVKPVKVNYNNNLVVDKNNPTEIQPDDVVKLASYVNKSEEDRDTYDDFVIIKLPLIYHEKWFGKPFDQLSESESDVSLVSFSSLTSNRKSPDTVADFTTTSVFENVKKMYKQEKTILDVIRTEGYEHTPALIHYNNDLCTLFFERCKGIDEVGLKTNAFLKLSDHLKELHKMDVLHGDIKPNNLVYNETKREYQFIDFGESVDFSTLRDGRNPDLGLYFPPEYSPPGYNISGKIKSKEADIYALGVCFFLVLSTTMEGEKKDTTLLSLDIFRKITGKPYGLLYEHLEGKGIKLVDLVDSENPIHNHIRGMLDPDPTERRYYDGERVEKK